MAVRRDYAAEALQSGSAASILVEWGTFHQEKRIYIVQGCSLGSAEDVEHHQGIETEEALSSPWPADRKAPASPESSPARKLPQDRGG